MAAEEHTRSLVTVSIAGVGNLLIAVAKLVAGLLTGSSAMLAEAAHSFADTLNQLFLLAGLHRSTRPADGEHPFGYGMERYFWSLLAAVTVFVLGAGFSVMQGVSALVHPHEPEHVGAALAVLAVALALDGASLVRAIWHVKSDPAPIAELEPTVRAVLFEDAAAVLGVLVAAAGLLLDAALDATVFDAIASLAIGVLLAVVAFVLGRQNQEGLIGRALPAEVLGSLRREIASTDGVEGVLELLTMRLGPNDVLLAARVAVDEQISGDGLVEVADEIDRRVREEFPDVRHVFVDPS